MWKVRSSDPSQVKAMTYQIDNCHYLAWHLGLLGYGMDIICHDVSILFDSE